MLNVGKDGSRRLDLLHGVLRKGTTDFLNEIGPLKGKKVLEVGCGIGNVTRIISELVGSEGMVLAIDVSDDQIKLASNRLGSDSYENVTFRVMSALDLDDIDEKFDVVYSRMTLMHIPNYVNVLQSMVGKIKVGGIIAMEEASNAYYFHYPFNKSYDDSRKFLLELFKRKGNDPYIGMKLHGEFSRLNLSEIKSKSIAPHYCTLEEKVISHMLLLEIKEGLIENNLLTSSEFDGVEEGLRGYVGDESTIITFPLMTQIYAKKI